MDLQDEELEQLNQSLAKPRLENPPEPNNITVNNVTNYNMFDKQSKGSSTAVAALKPQFQSVSSSMRRFKRYNHKWITEKPEENTLDLDQTQNSKGNELDKSNWNIPVQESKLGHKKNELGKDKNVIELESQVDSIDSKKLNFIKDQKQDLSKRQKISVDFELQEMFDSKKMEESMSKAIEKHLQNSVKLIEHKVKLNISKQFNKMWEVSLKDFNKQLQEQADSLISRSQERSSSRTPAHIPETSG